MSPTADTPSEPGFAYHATNVERMQDIAQSGLRTHRPDFGTDQTTWPDGSTEKRSYFTTNAATGWQFAPEEGRPALLRVPLSAARFKRESTGDLFVVSTIPARFIEVLTDGGWVGLGGVGLILQRVHPG